MFYTEVSYCIFPFSEDVADVLMAELGTQGFDSFSYTEEGFNAYIPSPQFNPTVLQELKTLPLLAKQYHIEWRCSEIENQDWNKLWEENFSPIVVQDKILVRADFHPSQPHIKHEIIINPKMSFGTGHHATTTLMLETILDMAPEFDEKNILDMGCGTGILSILAAQVGAASITGIDIDEWAYHNAMENLDSNHVTNARILIGDAQLLQEGTCYDIILANINRNILLEDMPRYADVLQPGGYLLLSGFYGKDLPLLQEKAASLHLSYLSCKTKDDWTAAVFQKEK